MLDRCHGARSQDSAGPLVMQWRKQDAGGKAHDNAWPQGQLARKYSGKTKLSKEVLERWWHEDVLTQDCRWEQVHLQVTALILSAFLPPQ